MRLALLVAGAALALPAVTAADPETGPAGGHICGVEAPGASAAPATALLTGYGTGGFAVATASPQAQAYFDNGMQLGHAFAHKPAIAAFQQAERLDPACAMCAWGEAWARGPTINYDISPQDQAALAGLADRAAALARNGPKKEQQLTAALQLRYHHGGGKGAGDYAFARAMDQLARDYPADNEIAIVAADAWMIPAAMKETRENLPRALELLTGALARAPADTGAIHFYIHATEMYGVGGAAERYAQTLQRLAPAASHLVHMPSHTYYIVGRYQDAVRSNLDAVTIDAANARRQGFGDDVWKLTYHSHNVQFAMGAALISGDAQAALSQSDATLAYARTGPKADGFLQMVVGTAYFAQARFAAPDRVLALPDPGAEHAYERAMWRYARGEAYARLRDAAGVRREAALVAADPAALKTWGGYAPQAAGMVEVARLVLTGRAAMIEGRPDAAAQAYRAAAQIQDSRLRRLSDPPGWWYPVRRSLAAALLAAGRADDAVAEARATLATWRNDPVTLALLAQAERKLGDGKAADLHLAQAQRGWRGVAGPLAAIGG